MDSALFNRTDARRGVTLMEVVVSTALVGMVLSAALTTLAMSVDSHRAAEERSKAYAEVEKLIAESLAEPYGVATGSTVTSVDGWSRLVRTELVSPTPSANGRLVLDNVDGGLKRVFVSVDSPTGQHAEAAAIRSAYGAHEEAPVVDRVWVTTLGVSVDAAGGASEVTAATINEPSEL